MIRVENRDRDGNPMHLFSYYLNEKGEKVRHGKEIKWWAPGIKEVEQTWKDGRKRGLMTLWYRNGNSQLIQFFRNDSIDSLEIRFFENGNKQRATYFKNHKIHGADTAFHENGKPHCLMTFKEGIWDGPYRMWYENGDPMWDKIYVNNKLEGEARWWWRHPHALGSIMHYVNGKEDGWQILMEKNGRVSQKYFAKGGQKSGPDTSWDVSGRIKKSGRWENGKYIDDNPIGKEGLK